MSNDYEVGFKKPPNHTKFQKGRSGNPNGRPQGSRNFSTDVKDTLKEPVRLTKGGKRKTVSTQLATLLRLREKALSGDPRAMDRMIELARTYNDEEIAETAAKLSLTDRELLKAYDKRVLRRAGIAKSTLLTDENRHRGKTQTLAVQAVSSELVSGRSGAISLLNREKTGNFCRNTFVGPQIFQ